MLYNFDSNLIYWNFLLADIFYTLEGNWHLVDSGDLFNCLAKDRGQVVIQTFRRLKIHAKPLQAI